MHVIGTAGHVDHGKSSLVQALTGIDPDRLKEEKDREMTIDLGFAWMTLEDSEEELGIIDVPGHRDFIENMLAGVGGIDLVLLVIAADEGVMPQTKEHLAILDLLQVSGGVIALTKIDLIDDDDWLELITLDITEVLTDSVLADAPIIGVSSHTGEGIDELKVALIAELAAISEATDLSRPRLPIDRVFSLTGFGTVVTGTLLEGQLNVGDAVQIQPNGLDGRIRGLQTHNTKIEMAKPGSRVAVNLSGINKSEIRRGDVLTYPQNLSGTILCDVSYEHLQGNENPLKHNQEVKFFSGAAEVVARTRVIGQKQLSPGQRGWLQLSLKESVALMRNDRYILRRPSPPATIGGGSILDPHPGRRYRRFKPDVVKHMETMERGQPGELLLDALSVREPTMKDTLIKAIALDHAIGESTYAELVASGQIVSVGQEIISADGYARTKEKIIYLIDSYHDDNPLRQGIQKEELRNRTKLAGPAFNVFIQNLEAEGRVQVSKNVIKLPHFHVRYTGEQEDAINSLMDEFRAKGVNSPSVKEAKRVVGEDVYYALLDMDRLKQISPDVVYERQEYQTIENQIIDYLRTEGQITVAQVRDLLDTSRKYAIAFLEYLDEREVTRREGDFRYLRK